MPHLSERGIARDLRQPGPSEGTNLARDHPGKGYAYIRLSTQDQTATDKDQMVQRCQLEDWALQRGCRLAEVVVEPSISGGIPFTGRPEGGKLWARLHEGDVLVAARLDRMFRSAADCLHVVEALRARGVSLFLLDLNGGADDVSGNGIAPLFLTIVSAFANFERELVGERIRATKRAQKARGEYLGGAPPFGWTYDADRKLVAIPEQQMALRRIREFRSRGLSLRRISEELAALGHTLSHVSVGNILAADEARRQSGVVGGSPESAEALDWITREGVRHDDAA